MAMTGFGHFAAEDGRTIREVLTYCLQSYGYFGRYSYRTGNHPDGGLALRYPDVPTDPGPRPDVSEGEYTRYVASLERDVSERDECIVEHRNKAKRLKHVCEEIDTHMDGIPDGSLKDSLRDIHTRLAADAKDCEGMVRYLEELDLSPSDHGTWAARKIGQWEYEKRMFGDRLAKAKEMCSEIDMLAFHTRSCLRIPITLEGDKVE